MMAEIKMLLRVKQLKEDHAYRALLAKRGQVARAKEDLERTRRLVAESAASLPGREAALWLRVLGRVVALADIDGVKAEIKALEETHQRLIDASERASHVMKRLDAELEGCTAEFRKAEKNKDKYVLLRDDVVAAWRSEVDAKEENEVEDLISTKRRTSA